MSPRGRMRRTLGSRTIAHREPLFRKTYQADARRLEFLQASSVDLVVTSPPYWRKRDYGLKGQIGQEETPEQYVDAIVEAMKEWHRVLRPTGSIFLNIGDTYRKKSLQSIPSLIETAAVRRHPNWMVRNRIIWLKAGRGMPDPARDRLVGRHEYILHFAKNGYYYDLFGYAEKYSEKGRGANPGDVWSIPPARNIGKHLAPFPREIAKRAILLACPEKVCSKCGRPWIRHVERTMQDLNLDRPQARRALVIAKEHGLTEDHFGAIRATGISDAGKAKSTQTGTNRNAEHIQRLAAHAKSILKGYFREFTFAKWKSSGIQKNCACRARAVPGVVLDPFMGTGTTLEVAAEMSRSAIGIDLELPPREGELL
jgi:DNA modification methylase